MPRPEFGIVRLHTTLGRFLCGPNWIPNSLKQLKFLVSLSFRYISKKGAPRQRSLYRAVTFYPLLSGQSLPNKATFGGQGAGLQVPIKAP